MCTDRDQGKTEKTRDPITVTQRQALTKKR